MPRFSLSYCWLMFTWITWYRQFLAAFSIEKCSVFPLQWIFNTYLMGNCLETLYIIQFLHNFQYIHSFLYKYRCYFIFHSIGCNLLLLLPILILKFSLQRGFCALLKSPSPLLPPQFLIQPDAPGLFCLPISTCLDSDKVLWTTQQPLICHRHLPFPVWPDLSGKRREGKKKRKRRMQKALIELATWKETSG